MQNIRGVVFVVDDEKLIAKTLAMILTQTGFTAAAFEDPFRALEAAADGPAPDLLISDVVMPGMSGIELAVRFRKEYPECKVLLFSGQAATADMLADAKRHGHDFEVLAKPVHPSDLLAKLRTLTQADEVRET
ncbi:MAG: response regulator [Terracidiphilus sp.]|jgi:CheY-like chemotaxis protein